MSYIPSLKTFPEKRAAMTVSISGNTYCIFPVASNRRTVMEMVIRAVPASVAADPIKA
jgi:hypothetical protein